MKAIVCFTHYMANTELIKLKKKYKLSDIEISKLLKVSRITVWRWRNEVHEMPFSKLQLLKKILQRADDKRKK